MPTKGYHLRCPIISEGTLCCLHYIESVKLMQRLKIALDFLQCRTCSTSHHFKLACQVICADFFECKYYHFLVYLLGLLVGIVLFTPI